MMDSAIFVPMLAGLQSSGPFEAIGYSSKAQASNTSGFRRLFEASVEASAKPVFAAVNGSVSPPMNMLINSRHGMVLVGDGPLPIDLLKADCKPEIQGLGFAVWTGLSAQEKNSRQHFRYSSRP